MNLNNDISSQTNSSPDIADMKASSKNLDLLREQEEDTSTDLTVSSTADSSSESGADDANNSERLTRVGFTSIEIRSYNRIAGDHPDVRNGGPPLGIGWEFVQQDSMDLDDYEQQKEQAKAESERPWLFGLRRLSSGKRRDILRMQFDIPIEEINAAEASSQRTRQLRAKTNNQKKVITRTEELMQSAKRKLQRSLNTPSVRDEERLLRATIVTPKQNPALKQPAKWPLKKKQPLPPAGVSTSTIQAPLAATPPMPLRKPMGIEVSI